MSKPLMKQRSQVCATRSSISLFLHFCTAIYPLFPSFPLFSLCCLSIYVRGIYSASTTQSIHGSIISIKSYQQRASDQRLNKKPKSSPSSDLTLSTMSGSFSSTTSIPPSELTNEINDRAKFFFIVIYKSGDLNEEQACELVNWYYYPYLCCDKP